jgi:thiamine-phosphate pyrophosphorylase
MKLVLISPPGEQGYEITTVQALLSAGLERYHLRKPGWDVSQVAAWLGALPTRWHGRIYLHSHHPLADCIRVGGIHFPDGGAEPSVAPPGCATSRSCHDVATVKAALGRYDSLLFGPVFPSLSKPGHGPAAESVLCELRDVLSARGTAEKRTKVFAIGGIAAQRLDACAAMGFDGAAILGAVWSAADPVAAFREFLDACRPRADVSPASMEATP